MYTWFIRNIYQNPHDKDHKPTDPGARYMWELGLSGSELVVSSGFDYAEVMLLMQHFRVDNIPHLVGQSFQSERGDASSALDLLLTQIRHGGKYVPPATEELRQRAAESMACGKQPDYSGIDDETVYRAFAEVWNGFKADVIWMNSFKAEISQISDGQAVLLDADHETFSARVKGPANYLMLVYGGVRQKVIMGPYSTPVSFVEDRVDIAL